MTAVLFLGGATSKGGETQTTSNVDCIDYIHNALKEKHIIFTDTELTCVSNWLLAECMGYEVTEKDYNSCLENNNIIQ